MLLNENQQLTSRSSALQLLVQSSAPQAIEAISSIIRSAGKHRELQIEAISAVALRKVDAIEIIDALVYALGDKTRRIKRLAAGALGEIGGASAIEPLSNLLSQRDLDNVTKATAVSALGKFHSSDAHFLRAMGILLNLLETKSYDEVVRAEAASNLGEFSHYKSINALKQVAEDEDEPLNVRMQAISALAGQALKNEERAWTGASQLLRLKPSGSYILDPSIMHGGDWLEARNRRDQYANYLESIRERLPEGAKAYAFGQYQIGGGPEWPHDSRLHSLEMKTHPADDQSPYPTTLDIHLRLLGSYEDGYIDFHYYEVNDYLLVDGGDWMYDEVRLGEEGRVIHEIRFLPDSHWLIECRDFSYEWKPFDTTSVDR